MHGQLQSDHMQYKPQLDKQRADLKAAAKLALPTAGAPKEMQRTSAVGHCTAAQVAAKVATDPPMQKPVVEMRRGVVSSAQQNSIRPKRLRA